MLTTRLPLRPQPRRRSAPIASNEGCSAAMIRPPSPSVRLSGAPGRLIVRSRLNSSPRRSRNMTALSRVAAGAFKEADAPGAVETAGAGGEQVFKAAAPSAGRVIEGDECFLAEHRDIIRRTTRIAAVADIDGAVRPGALKARRHAPVAVDLLVGAVDEGDLPAVAVKAYSMRAQSPRDGVARHDRGKGQRRLPAFQRINRRGVNAALFDFNSAAPRFAFDRVTIIGGDEHAAGGAIESQVFGADDCPAVAFVDQRDATAVAERITRLAVGFLRA